MLSHTFLLLALWAGGFLYCFLRAIAPSFHPSFSAPFLALLVIFTWAGTHPPWNDLWLGRWQVTLLLLALGLACRIGERVSWALAPLFYSVVSSSIITLYGDHARGDVIFTLSLMSGSGAALAAFLLIFATMGDRRLVSRLGEGLGVLGLLTALLVLLSGDPLSAPIFDNLSMAGIFLVLTLPLLTAPPLKGRLRLVATVLTTLAVLSLGKRAPWVALLSLGAVLIAHQRRRPYQGAFYYAGLFWVGVWAFATGHLDTNGRSFVWSWALHYWWDLGLVGKFFGAGLGTFRVHSPTYLPSTEVFFWAHNDWLQILFELGLTGLLASLLLYFRSLQWSSERPYLQAALVAYGVSMLTNYPLHWPLHALLGATLVAQAYYARHV